jgi:hypothetical protein
MYLFGYAEQGVRRESAWRIDKNRHNRHSTLFSRSKSNHHHGAVSGANVMPATKAAELKRDPSLWVLMDIQVGPRGISNLRETKKGRKYSAARRAFSSSGVHVGDHRCFVFSNAPRREIFIVGARAAVQFSPARQGGLPGSVFSGLCCAGRRLRTATVWLRFFSGPTTIQPRPSGRGLHSDRQRRTGALAPFFQVYQWAICFFKSGQRRHPEPRAATVGLVFGPTTIGRQVCKGVGSFFQLPHPWQAATERQPLAGLFRCAIGWQAPAQWRVRFVFSFSRPNQHPAWFPRDAR